MDSNWADSQPLLKDADKNPTHHHHHSSATAAEGDAVAGPSATATSTAAGVSPLPTKLRKEKATAAWFDEFANVEESEGALLEARPTNPFLQKYNVPHQFTEEERKRMDKYESIDYWEPQSLIYKQHLRERRKQHRWGKWIVFSLIGIAVGLWSVILFQTLDLMGSLKVKTLETIIRNSANDIKKGDSNWQHNNPTIRSGAPVKSVMIGYFVWMLWCCLAAICASLCCVLMPTAAGSGVPEVMAFLNGVTLPRIFNIRTLFVKTLSCILAVNSGLPVGAEGPMIHCGALIGAGLPTGRSRSLRCSLGSLLGTFRNTKDHRDFVTAGSAAGVTAAFGSPIGGLLFVMEEIASFFPVKLAWLVFFSCLTCIFSMHLTNSFLKGWDLRDREGMPVGNFKDSVLTLFNTDYASQAVSMNLLTFVPTIIIGLIFGAVAIGFTLMNINVLRMRNKKINPSAIKRVLEPLIFISLFASISYFVPFTFKCETIPAVLKADGRDIDFISEFCEDPETQFNPMATLTLTSAYNTIKILYTRYTHNLISWEALLVYQVLYTLGAAYCGGMFLSSGIVIPTLLIGAIGGRCIGVWFDQPWADPGVTALIGSASFFGGLSRLTFSLVVIMMEITNDLTHIATLMVGVFIAKTVADRFCHSLYHAILEVKCVPYLDVATKVHHLDTNGAKDIMTPRPVCIPTVCKIVQIVEILKTTQFNCFPVVSVADKQTFKGTIQRSQLEQLLWYIHFRNEDDNGATRFTDAGAAAIRVEQEDNDTLTVAGGNHASYADLAETKERLFWNRLSSIPELTSSEVHFNLDLNPYIDTSALFVHETMSVSKAYDLFRNMGLRHLTVVNRSNHVTGILSRKNLVGDRMMDKIKAVNSGKKSS